MSIFCMSAGPTVLTMSTCVQCPGCALPSTHPCVSFRLPAPLDVIITMQMHAAYLQCMQRLVCTCVRDLCTLDKFWDTSSPQHPSTLLLLSDCTRPQLPVQQAEQLPIQPCIAPPSILHGSIDKSKYSHGPMANLGCTGF